MLVLMGLAKRLEASASTQETERFVIPANAGIQSFPLVEKRTIPFFPKKTLCDDLGKTQSGATLIELIVSIVVISVALTGLMMTISISMRHSADGFVQIRAAELAQAYMDMLVTMEYDADCTVSSITPGCQEEDERNIFNSLKCFQSCGRITDSIPWNVNATLGSSYDAYEVEFEVTTSTLNGTQGKMIQVDVIIPARDDETISFSTFRAAF